MEMKWESTALVNISKMGGMFVVLTLENEFFTVGFDDYRVMSDYYTYVQNTLSNGWEYIYVV